MGETTNQTLAACAEPFTGGGVVVVLVEGHVNWGVVAGKAALVLQWRGDISVGNDEYDSVKKRVP